MFGIVQLRNGASVPGIVGGEDHGEGADGAGEGRYEEEDAQLLLVNSEPSHLRYQVLIRHNDSFMLKPTSKNVTLFIFLQLL